MTIRLDGLYDIMVELEEKIEDAKLKRRSVEMNAVTANQKIILKAFGIDANYIKRKAEQISNELNPKVLKVKINGRKS